MYIIQHKKDMKQVYVESFIIARHLANQKEQDRQLQCINTTCRHCFSAMLCPRSQTDFGSRFHMYLLAVVHIRKKDLISRAIYTVPWVQAWNQIKSSLWKHLRIVYKKQIQTHSPEFISCIYRLPSFIQRHFIRWRSKEHIKIWVSS